MEQSRLEEFTDEGESDDWTYAGEETNYLTHGLHPYPARMIPQIARRLILTYSNKGDLVWDPFCGSGTTLIESMLSNRKSIGTDLNPFAVFLSRVKTTIIPPDELDESMMMILKRIAKAERISNVEIPALPNINYWFKDYVQEDLARLRLIINETENEIIRDFFKLCLSLTVREVSNLKKREFKIVRMKPEKLAEFNPDVINTFSKYLNRNVRLMKSFAKFLSNMRPPIPIIFEIDNRLAPIDPESIDLVVTSPPYGDSGTTVAYGQFSKYPALWIGLDETSIKSVDKLSLGGQNHRSFDNIELPSPTLNETYARVKENSAKRAKQVYNFFYDLNQSLESIHEKLKQGTRACIVIGNRLVSRVRIPTDMIIAELAKELGFTHEKTIYRDIPTKRMPWQNAPENVEGIKADTMHKESIVILRKD